MSQGEDFLRHGFTDERRALLSTSPATGAERRLALAAIAASAAIFLALVPFAKSPLPQLWAFIPMYQSALAVNDLITAVLLFGQFSFVRSKALLVLGGAYLFTALMAIAHGLTFPGLFAEAGLLGAGPQTTAWMYMLWHAGFPALIIVYALVKGPEAETRRVPGPPRAALLACIGIVAAAACAATLLATAGHALLPSIMLGNRYTPAMIFVVGGVWGLSVLALGALWTRRPHSVLDLWLMVVMCAWIFDIALSAVFNAGRFDLGFYAGRLYGLLAGSFVLIVLLVQSAFLYGRLMAAHEGEYRERRRAQEKAIELGAANKELEAFSYSVSHDLRAPLRAIDGYSRLLADEHGARLDPEGRRLLEVLRSNAQRMGRLIHDLLEFSRLGQLEAKKDRVDTTQLAGEVATELARDFPAAQVAIAELPPAFADRAMLRQVWVNLLANALKYSAGRQPSRVEVGGRAEEEENLYWVRDNGVGFDMRYASRLFGVFQRLHSEEEFPGTGVGLAIVQRVVLRHRGRVWAEAKPGEGAVLYFTLPREAG